MKRTKQFTRGLAALMVLAMLLMLAPAVFADADAEAVDPLVPVLDVVEDPAPAEEPAADEADDALIPVIPAAEEEAPDADAEEAPIDEEEAPEIDGEEESAPLAEGLKPSAYTDVAAFLARYGDLTDAQKAILSSDAFIAAGSESIGVPTTGAAKAEDEPGDWAIDSVEDKGSYKVVTYTETLDTDFTAKVEDAMDNASDVAAGLKAIGAEWSAFKKLDFTGREAGVVTDIMEEYKDSDPAIYNAWTTIKETCTTDGQLTLSLLFTEAYSKQGDADHVTGFYQSDDAQGIVDEVAKLKEQMDALFANEARLREMLETEVPSSAESLMNSMTRVKSSIETGYSYIAESDGTAKTADDTVIDTSSDGLYDLVSGLLTAADEGLGEFSPEVTYEVAAPAAGYVKAVVNTETTTGALDENVAFEVYDETDDEAKEAALAALAAKAGASVDELVGSEVSDLYSLKATDEDSSEEGVTVITYTYAPKTYTAYVGEESFPVDVINRTVPLEAGDGVITDFTYKGVTTSLKKGQSSSYTFSVDDLRSGDLTIAKKTFSVDDLFAEMVAKVDASLAPKLAAMAYEDGMLIVRVSPDRSANTQVLKDIVSGVAKTVTDARYSGIYLGVGGYELYDGNNGIYDPQAIVDAILHSDTDLLKAIVAAVKSNGDINEKWPDKVDSHGYHYGAPIIESTVEYGEGAGSKTVPLYITIEDEDQATSALKTVRSNSIRLDRHADITLADGAINLICTSQKAYAAYVAGAAASNYADISDLENMSEEEYMNFLFAYVTEIIDKAEDGEVTVQTFKNTLDMLKVNDGSLDKLSGYFTKAYKYLVKGYGYLEMTGKSYTKDADSSSFTVSYQSDLTPAYNKANLDPGVQKGLGKDIHFDVTAKIMKKDFVAVVIAADNVKETAKELKDRDISELKDDIKRVHIARDTDQLNAILANDELSGANNTIVLLVAEVGEVTVPAKKNVVIDLNGQTARSISSSATKCVIVDGTLEDSGCVGSVSGSVIVTGGNYASDPSAYLRDDYKTIDGPEGYSYRVFNGLYDIVKEGTTYKVYLDVDRISLYNIPDAKALAIELAADLATNFYNAAKLVANGYTLYDVNNANDAGLSDFVSLYQNVLESDANAALKAIDEDGVYDFANDVLDDLLNGTHFRDAIKGANPGLIDPVTETIHVDGAAEDVYLGKYTYSKTGWGVEVEVADGDYFTGHLTSGGNTTDATVEVYLSEIDGMTEDAMQKTYDVIYRLVDVTTVNKADFTHTGEDEVYYEGKTLHVNGGSAIADVEFNLRGTATDRDPNYAVALAVIAANWAKDNGKTDLYDALVAGIKETADAKAEGKYKINTLKEAMESMGYRDGVDAMEYYHRSYNSDFATLAANVGLSDEYIETLANQYWPFLVTLSKSMRVAEQVADKLGLDYTISNVEKSIQKLEGEFGVYSMTNGYEFEKAVTRYGYTVDVNLATNNDKLTLKLFWPEVETYTVTYDANGGTGAPDSQTEEVTKDLTLSSDVPTREGYKFLGWATTPDATTPEYQPGDLYTLREDITLYAVWEKIETPATPTPTAEPDVTPAPTEAPEETPAPTAEPTQPTPAQPTPVPPAPTEAPKGDVPKTGDESSIALWIGVMMVCGAAAIVLLKKKSHN